MQQHNTLHEILENPVLLQQCENTLTHPEWGFNAPEPVPTLWDVLHQPDPRAVYQLGPSLSKHAPLVGAAAMNRVIDWLLLGELAVIDIPVGEEPGPDSDNQGNNDILSRLPEGFSAKFEGGTTQLGNDGTFYIEQPLQIPVPVRNGHVVINPCAISLEVGATWGSTTLFHLGQEMSLVRWPYGQKHLTVMILLQQQREAPVDSPVIRYGYSQAEGDTRNKVSVYGKQKLGLTEQPPLSLANLFGLE